ncbi:hypothetical protein SUGI_0940570 [Cryptomeria japonica]|uniref:uncharacterized protein LOC131075989 n=1 Tax=Cryptomeria japonica TaxID=3369 RepID=UPI0024147874|nr:uncharacterized protein LOC131075989 [Cryptomeria japonica]GLJ44731.1 hypothetical protein SUGI_0940570 [Cryptomeria japonica]
MGSCMSSGCTRDHEKPLNSLTSKLILMDGSIKEFSGPVKCHEMASKYSGHFICGSGGLYTGQHISEVLHEDDELQLGELYFLLPNRKLEFVLTDSDMAAMLLKANGASEQRRKSKGKVQPLFDGHLQDDENPPPSVCCLSKPVSTVAMCGRKQRKQSKLETIYEGS